MAENDKSAVLIEIEEDASPLPGPDAAPPVPELVEMPTGAAMQAADAIDSGRANTFLDDFRNHFAGE